MDEHNGWHYQEQPLLVTQNLSDGCESESTIKRVIHAFRGAGAGCVVHSTLGTPD